VGTEGSAIGSVDDRFLGTQGALLASFVFRLIFAGVFLSPSVEPTIGCFQDKILSMEVEEGLPKALIVALEMLS
jgi:hypothetical protein